MADTPADTSAIATALGQPLSAAVDGQSATGRSTADLVLGIQFMAAAIAATLPHRGLRFTQAIGPAQCPAPRRPLSFYGGGGSYQ